MRPSCRELVVACWGWLALACSTPAESIVGASARSAPAPRSCKPEAPVEVALDATATANGEVELVLVATPTADVAGVELALILPPGATLVAGRAQAASGSTRAGEPRALTARARLPSTAEVAGVARVPVAGVLLARDATVMIGAPAPRPTKRFVTADGDLVEEVRP